MPGSSPLPRLLDPDYLVGQREFEEDGDDEED